MRIRPLWLSALCIVVAPACSADTGTTPDPIRQVEGPLSASAAPVRAITNVQVVDPATGAVTPGQSVVIRDGRIAEVGPVATTTVPADAAVVDGQGRWLAPGLLDMHVHMRAGDEEDYVRAGITRVRHMWGYPTLWNLIDEIARGDRIGPTIHPLSSGIDAPPVYWPVTQLLTDPARADSLVAELAERGYTELKVYQDLSTEVYDSVAAAARRRGMTWAGHKPTRVPLEHVITAGQRSIEHLGGYEGLPAAALSEVIALTAEEGTWNGPTLAIQDALQNSPTRAATRRRIVAELHQAGAPLLVGTDSGIDVTRPGESLVDEMSEFVRAGIPLREVLRLVTIEAARYLGLESEIGRIAPGWRADLVLLAGNPLEDLVVLRTPVGVHMGDRWIVLEVER